MQRTLDQALADLADGDRSAFDEVYRAAWPRVRSLAFRLMAQDPEADDVAQQALLTVFERASTYDSTRPALPWILGITAYSVKTHRRRTHRRREVDLTREPAGGVDPESELVLHDLVQHVHAEIGGLSELDRATLSAAMAGEGSGPTFRKRLERALGRLRLGWRRTHGT